MKGNNKRFEELINRVNEENKFKRINIRVRKLKFGYSVYLDFFRNWKHEYYFFADSQKLTGLPEKIEDDILLMDFIRNFRDEKERELRENPESFRLTFDSVDIDFMAYYEDYAIKMKRPQYQGSLKHLKNFTKNRPVPFRDLNVKFFENFRDYLLTKIGQNTVVSYLDVVRATLNRAVKEKLIKENPLKEVRLKEIDTEIEFLEDAEIQSIINLKTDAIDVKNAFLFSCFTGLRKSDVIALTFDRIRDDSIYFRQQKTSSIENFPLSNDAMKIIDEQRARHPESERVFEIGGKANIQRKLKEILQAAQIKKSIHYHCSRHTFAVRALNSGIGIFQLSKLLGHSDIKTTQVYLKFVTEEKRKELKKLPTLM